MNLLPKRRSKRKSLEERFMPKWEPSESMEYLGIPCWEWHAAIDTTGYGAIGIGKGKGYAHRAAYELFVGPIPDGMELDHLCRNRSCVNPLHLEPVTHRENWRRGMSPPSIAVKRGTCVRGHDLNGPNMYVRANGRRRCRECTNAYNTYYQAKLKEQRHA